MEKLVIVVGDTTSHGGEVLTGDLTVEISDRPAAGVGDHVHCPMHGDTTIIEGYQTVTIQPSRHLAYEGCKTSCGATLIGGKQTICYIGFDDEPEPTAPHAAFEEVKKAGNHSHPAQPVKHSQGPHHKKRHKDELQKKLESNTVYPNDDEFNLFVATIWGEASNQSVTGWKAVGSVILNRVEKYRWDYRKSVTDIIYNTGFDAVHSAKNKEFPKAIAYLFENNIHALTAFETMRMKALIEAVKPIYYEKRVITTANYYHSPKAQKKEHDEELKKPYAIRDVGKHPLIPSFITGDPLVKEVHVELSPKDDLKFFYGPHNKK